MSETTLDDLFPALIPLVRHDRIRSLWRQAQQRYWDLKHALGGVTLEIEPVHSGQDPSRSPQYLGIPIPAAFRRTHRQADGTFELFVLPHPGAGEIDVELREHLRAGKLGQAAPELRSASETEGWLTATSSREREEARLFGSTPSHVLVNPDLDSHEWCGSFVIFSPRDPEDPLTIFTSGLSDRDLTGEPMRHSRDYELYLQTMPGGERWALNLLQSLVLSVLQGAEDHLAAVRTARHVAISTLSIPGLDAPFAFLLGIRTSQPRALPISGGATKVIPVTLIHPVELGHGQSHGFEELAALLVEEGPGIVSDPTRPPVVGTGRKRGWKLW